MKPIKSSAHSLLAEFLLFLAYASVLIFSSSDVFADAGDWTIHTVSVHVAAPDGMNNINPGAGYDVTDNVRIGALYNSYRKPSAYLLAILPLSPRFRIGAGLISGYTVKDWQLEGKTAAILPAVAAEVDITKRVSVVWFGQAVNLELKF